MELSNLQTPHYWSEKILMFQNVDITKPVQCCYRESITTIKRQCVI